MNFNMYVPTRVLFDRVGSNPLKSTVEAGAVLAGERGFDFINALTSAA